MAAGFPSNHSFRVCCFMYISIFVVLTLVVATRSSTKAHLHFRYSDAVNITNLLQQYALVCGLDLICDPSLTHFNFLANSKNHKVTECGACDCSDNCFKDNTCCPDKVLVGPISTCLSANLTANFEKPPRYWITATCPSDDLDLQNKCDSEKQSRRNVYNLPVTSPSGITYRNRFCAMCHNETATTQWKLRIGCIPQESISDFNYVSSITEMIQLAGNNSCEMEYLPDQDHKHFFCQSMERVTIAQCNVTGEWKKFNSDIDWACQNYDAGSTYTFFKNIFCYICNPPAQGIDVISHCNETGAWRDYDRDLIRACEEYPRHHRTYPFKNVYCYRCNRGDQELSDINTEPIKRLQDSSVLISFGLKQFRSEKNYTLNSKLIREREWKPRMRPDGVAVNFTNLLMNHLLYEGGGLCGDYGSPFLRENPVPTTCGCDMSCIAGRSCCIDFALTATDFCTSNQALTNEHYRQNDIMYAIIDQCPQNFTDNFTKHLCEFENDNDIKTLIPVHSLSTSLVYKNMYCAMCSEPITVEFVSVSKSITRPPNSNRELLPSDITIECSPFTDFTFSTNLKSILHFSQESRCLIKTMNKAHSNLECAQKDEEHVISRCNTTGLWSVDDRDIEWACQDAYFPYLPKIDGYSNIFCKMCNLNSTFPAEGYIDKCDSEMGVNADIVAACRNYPPHYGALPFKNVFCRSCFPQPPVMPQPDVHSSGTREEARMDIPYRILFSFTVFNTYEVENTRLPKTCLEDEIYDSYMSRCVQIECSPGKILENRTCVPLLGQGAYLRYNLFFGMVATLSGNVPKWRFILKELAAEVSAKLSNIFEFKIEYASYYLTSNVPCDFHMDVDTHVVVNAETHILNRTTVKVMYQASFIITSMVDRLETEETLMAFKTRVFNVTVNTTLVTFYGYTDTNAFYLSSHISTLKSSRMCYVYRHFPFESKLINRHAPLFEAVSDVMTCKQIPITTTNYKMSYRTRQVYVAFLDRSYDIDEYRIGDDGAINVCLNNYNKSSSIPEINKIDTALGIFTIVCTCFSLVALLLSFITYMLFDILRTIPGKNNICLIVALFFAQATFQFGLYQTDNGYVCVALGLISHYFWLATFFCMTLCCFHMFRAFDVRRMTSYDKRNSNQLVRRYCMFSFGTPLLIIILNSGITAAINEKVFFGYGPQLCFLTNIYAVGFALVLPLIACITANVVFFSITMKNIHSSPKIQSTRRDRGQILVYIKLFSLTGLTWILQLLDSNLQISAFSFLATFLNGCQGVFIFLSYICNKRVLSLYKVLFLHHRRETTRSNIQTNSKESHSTNTQSSRLTDSKL